MRHLLVNLQGVPEEEAQGMRALLNQHNIVFYETYAGRWRIGLAAIWLPNEDQKEEAHALLNEFQKELYLSSQNERERLNELGVYQAILQQWYREPLKTVMSLLAIIIVLFISIIPFTHFFITGSL